MVMANESTEVIEEIIPLDPSQEYDTIVVGAGAAGIGAAIALMHAGVEKFFVVDRDTVGASFDKWPAETRFITPSFPSNSIGMLDLNSIAVGVSPAFSMKVEHPTGQQYAQHLRNISTFFEIPILEHTNVNAIEKSGDLFHLHFDEGSFMAKNVIWAAGEFQYPKTTAFDGVELCRHTATVPSYAELEGDDVLIIGGYESGVDAAYHLADNGKNVHVFDRGDPWGEGSSNPSIALATYTIERTRHACFAEHVSLHPNTGVKQVTFSDGTYELTTEEGDVFRSKPSPCLLVDLREATPSSPTCLIPGKTVSLSSASTTNPPPTPACTCVGLPSVTATKTSVSSTNIGNGLAWWLRPSPPHSAWTPRNSSKPTVAGECSSTTSHVVAKSV